MKLTKKGKLEYIYMWVVDQTSVVDKGLLYGKDTVGNPKWAR